MKVFLLLSLLLVVLAVKVESDSQFWKLSQQFFNPFSWMRQGKADNNLSETAATSSAESTTSTLTTIKIAEPQRSLKQKATTPITTRQTNPWTTVWITTQTPRIQKNVTNKNETPTTVTTTISAASTTTSRTTTTTQSTTNNFDNVDITTALDTTTQEVIATTEEPRDSHRVQHDFYLSKREKTQVKTASNISQNLLPLPAGASAALVKPTKYHYYPHNQHIYLLPECAIQQVCNAVYVRLNWTQPLCACPSRYRDPCSASLNSDDQHTTELMTDKNSRRALTLVKTCEPTTDMRVCRTPRDWSLLALQNIRTGKSHYLVICRCPDTSVLEGPMSHDQPTYASVPGIRVYGMMCVSQGGKRRSRAGRALDIGALSAPSFPWKKAVEFMKTVVWND